MGFLSKEDILKADDSYSEVEEVPEWGGKVKIVSLSLKDRLELEAIQSNNEKKDALNMDALLFVLCKCLQDDEGNMLFNEKDAKKLLAKSSKVVYRLFSRCMKVNQVVTEKEGLPLEKNLNPVLSKDSLID